MNEQLEMIRKICDSKKHKNPIRDIMRECRRDQPEIVCLCGSTRFMEAFQAANLKETMAGKIVLSVGCNTKADSDIFKFYEYEDMIGAKGALDELHKRKIDLADEVLVLNVDGYIGDSTRSEIEYAEANGKPVRYLQPLNAAGERPGDPKA